MLSSFNKKEKYLVTLVQGLPDMINSGYQIRRPGTATTGAGFDHVLGRFEVNCQALEMEGVDSQHGGLWSKVRRFEYLEYWFPWLNYAFSSTWGLGERIRGREMRDPRLSYLRLSKYRLRDGE